MGEIYIDGQAMSSVPANHRPVNMVFQSYAIFPHLNVKQNIGYSLVQDKLPKAEFDAKVGEMLDLIKLPGYEDRASHELSGGERQRVALARALIRRWVAAKPPCCACLPGLSSRPGEKSLSMVRPCQRLRQTIAR